MAVNYQFVPMCYLQAQFEDPLGGATAMEDLRESFGFEGDLAQPGSPTEQVTSPFRRQSGLCVCMRVEGEGRGIKILQDLS